MTNGDTRLLITLRPESDVAIEDDRFVAKTNAPWLAFDEQCAKLWAGSLLEITYRASLLDEPVRPVFRFWLRDGHFVDRIAPAPIAGAGIWMGRIPARAVRMSVSPTFRTGPFDFRIERVQRLTWFGLLLRAFGTGKRAARGALFTRLIGWLPESDVNLSWALCAKPLESFTVWQARRARPPELDTIDRPRFDWSKQEPVRILVIGDAGDGLDRTLTALGEQICPRWTALVVSHARKDCRQDPRIMSCCRNELPDNLRKTPRGSLMCLLQPGDVLLPHALAHLVEQAHRFPTHRLFYGDMVQVTENGQVLPFFQPGWSPRLQTARGGPPPPLFVRDMMDWPVAEIDEFIVTGRLPQRFMSDLCVSEVMPLRRILLERCEQPAQPSIRVQRETPAPTNARAAIIIPTRDHPALLRRAIASIKARTPSDSRFQIVVVDNGSTSAEARAVLDKLEKDRDILRLDRPGAFNFSLLCNEAAAATDTDVLVFLNDDTEVLNGDWLSRLVSHALDPSIGAVGAKLTYPSGPLQHIGIVVGMGESAGHIDALEPANAAGWADRNRVVHEVSAVTGACLAVARDKFNAVGGFDAEHLPIELSDVDLCLKLNERGWQTIVDPQVHLMHEESVSRGGATFRRLGVYEDQRAIFAQRWGHVIRDDPFFHPGLSLYSVEAALG